MNDEITPNPTEAKHITSNHFYTLASKDGEIMLGSESEISDFPGLVNMAADEVGHNLYNISQFLKKYGLRRIQAANYYNLDTGVTHAPEES